MFSERLMVAAIAALITLLALAPLAWVVYRHLPSVVATVDLQRLVEEEQQRLAGDSGQGQQATAESRALAEKRSVAFAKRLSTVVDELSLECGCVLVNKAALLGGGAHDYTDVVRDRIGRLP